NACAAARARFAARAEAGFAHRRLGHHDGAEWLASAAGSSPAEARKAMDAAAHAGLCPETEQAWRTGELSLAQASEIVQTEQARPGSEAAMLEAAKRKSLRVLKEKGRHERLSAVDAGELRAKQRKARHFRSWTDELGMV